MLAAMEGVIGISVGAGEWMLVCVACVSCLRVPSL